MSPRTFFPLLLALAMAGPLSAQAATAFTGAGGTPGDVEIHLAGGSVVRPPELQGIVLLPVDAAGRVAFTQFVEGEPRLKTDIPLASRVLLPHEQGSLYRYSKTGPGGPRFGYFVVRPDGQAMPLLSFPGGAGIGDPIPDPVAVSELGDAILIATTPAAGGDVYEVELATATAHLLSADLPPLTIVPQGLVLLPVWGAVLTAEGPLRFLRGGGPLRAVRLEPKMRQRTFGGPIGAAPVALNYMGRGFVRSADGGTLAVVAGVSPTQAHVFAFHAFGASTCVNDLASPIVDPGFGTQASPRLALAPDGSRVAWKTVAATGEIFTRAVSTLPGPVEFHITSNANFTDTLNDTGVISFFDPRTVAILVGETNGAGGIENGDIYTTHIPVGGGQPIITNLTATSGDTVTPFLSKGNIETADGIYQIPGQGGSMYFVPGSSGQGSLYRVDTAGTVRLVRSGVAQVDFIDRAGTNFVLSVLHDATNQHELVRLPFNHLQPATSLASFPFTQPILAHSGNQAGSFAATVSSGAGQSLFQLSFPNGLAEVLPGIFPYGPALGYSSDGSVLVSAFTSGRQYYFSWALQGTSSIYGNGPAQSIVLPAN